MSFLEELNRYPYGDILTRIQGQSEADVKRALMADRLRIDEFMALLSPAATPFLEEMAVKAHRLTLQRFGNTILMYAPLYLSNVCSNGCRYCGFNATNKVRRRTLTVDEIEQEAGVVHGRGFRHILLVTGDAQHAAGNDYIARAAERVGRLFSSISIEVYPMDKPGYGQMVAAGVDGLTIYQETYNQDLYAEMHPFGNKRDFEFRLKAPERGGTAGFRRISIGALLGLGPFSVEGFFTGLHALYLARHFWRTHLSVSLPRMRPAVGSFTPPHPVSDREFTQLLCALRLFLPDFGISLSTRESPSLRDNLLRLGITQMSAGSCTSPGGYSQSGKSAGQFEISDERTAAEVEQMIRSNGYEAVWKDWDQAFLNKPL
jgi:2-iminoacetate synthase